MILLKETRISRGVIFLLATGLIMLVLGVVLWMAKSGTVPCYEEGVYGLLLIVFGLYLQTGNGCSPGLMKRSYPVYIPGVIITAIGFVTCFIPGFFGNIPKILVMLIGVISSIGLLIHLFDLPGKPLSGKRDNHGVLPSLAVIGVPVCILMILAGLVITIQIFLHDLLSPGFLAVFVLFFGITIISLAVILQKINPVCPESDVITNAPGMSPDMVMGKQYGYYMLILGCLLIPVNLGLLPYALSAIHGTLAVLVGVQALVAGKMMAFDFKRNRISFLVGIGFVAVGACAIIVPDMIVEALSIFIGAFITLGGLYLFSVLLRPKHELSASKPEGKDLYLLILLIALVLLTALFMILFGLSLLIKNLIPGIIIAIILICFGLSQFFLLHVLSMVEKNRVLRG